MTRRLRRLLIASAAALVAGAAALLALAAAADAWARDGATVLVALAAVWLSMGITPLIRTRRRPE